MNVAAMSILCTLVVGCVPAPLPGSLPAPLTGDLRSAREACNREYPRRIGNYLPHAQCVNAAVERYAMPTASHPDLIRLQEGVRAALSGKVDRRQISVSAGGRRMAEADRLIAGPSASAMPEMMPPRPAGSRRSKKYCAAPVAVAGERAAATLTDCSCRTRPWEVSSDQHRDGDDPRRWARRHSAPHMRSVSMSADLASRFRLAAWVVGNAMGAGEA